MCLLVKQPKATIFTDAFLEDVFGKNSDGLGVMYAEEGKLHVYKCLPATAKDFIDFYRKHAEGRDCVWHARMKTHGDIDFENCHPYLVTEDIWMAHNGILSTGNKNDKTKSDTWHFIRNVLRPALTANPDLILDPEYQNYLGDMIGNSNKFGFVRADGEIVIINEQAGVEFENAWLSNTYAWTPSKFGFRSAYQGNGGYTDMYSGYNRGWWSAYDNDEYPDYGVSPDNLTPKGFGKVGKQYKKQPPKAVAPTAAQVSPMIKAAYNQWVRRGLAGIEQWVYDAPHKAVSVLAYWYDDVEGIEDLVDYDPDEAAVWIEDLFRSDSITPSMLN